MRYVKLLLFSIWFSLLANCFAQQSFEVRYSTPASEGFYSAFEDQNNDIIAIGSRNTEFGADSSCPLIVKLDKFGNIVQEKVLQKTNTTGLFKYGFQKHNGNYFIMGALSDSVTPKHENISYLCEFDPRLNLVWEKMYTLPGKYHSHFIENFLITPDSNIIIQGRADSSLNGSNDNLYLSLFDMDGNLIEFKFYENWHDWGYGDLLFKPDSSGFYLLGEIVEYSFPRDWIEFDYNLNFIGYGFTEDSLSYLLTPLSAKRLSNGNIFIANRSYGIQFPAYQDLEIRIVDPNFELLKDTIIFYDEYVYIPVNKGLDFTDQNNIWVGSFENTFPFFPGTEVFRLHIFDTEMKLKGVKEFGGDTRFWLYQLLATSDGGCLITGTVPDYEGSHNNDGYILKVMPEDILTHVEEIPDKNESEISVFPNPFSNYIQTETTQKGLVFNLFDYMSRQVFSGSIDDIQYSSINTIHLPSGLYYYSICYENNKMQSGKLLKL